MAEPTRYPIDVAELWGPEGEAELSPATSFVPPPELRPVDAEPVHDGDDLAPAAASKTLVEVDRLAEAIAGNLPELLRRTDLDAMRKELEGAFTQQLALVVYELMAAWDTRFASIEDRLNQRMGTAVEAQTSALAASIEASFYAVLEISETVRAELRAFGDQLAGVESLPTFQREIRHEVARLGDLACGPRPEAAVMAEMTTVMTSELAELREELCRLRAAVDARAPRSLSVSDL